MCELILPLTPHELRPWDWPFRGQGNQEAHDYEKRREAGGQKQTEEQFWFVQLQFGQLPQTEHEQENRGNKASALREANIEPVGADLVRQYVDN